MDDELDLSFRIEEAKRRYRESVCDRKDEPLEVRRRTVRNGGKHFVWQCMRCGEQRGGPLSASAAHIELAGREPLEFDTSIEGLHRQEQAFLLHEWTSLTSQELEQAHPGFAATVASATAASQARLAHIESLVDECAEQITSEVGEVTAADTLSRKAIAMRRDRWEQAIRDTERFPDEDALKDWLTAHLSEDFELYPEVHGRHIATGVRVQIDFLAYPKQHLIDAGFLDDYFGIEVKHLNAEDGFSQKAAKAFWQTVSYTDSEFFVNGTRVRLKYAVLFSSMSFEKERKLLKALGHTLENDAAAWHALRQLANHANVGTLEIRGEPATWKGWLIAFAGGRYFGRRASDNGPVYRLWDSRMVEKTRIGSF